jgi:hypothetical protein
MRLRVGSSVRPLNEAVAQVSYKPVYDITRKVSKLIERWDITGRVILQTNASQTAMTAELNNLSNALSQEGADIAFMEDYNNIDTKLALYANQCLVGPYIVDSGFPNAQGDIYSNGMSYRVVYEAERLAGVGGNLLQFEEQILEAEGGEEHGYVGGAVNYPERQVFAQHKPFRYRQSGSATGLFAHPTIPPPIWPWAQLKRPEVTYASPKVLGNVDQEFTVSWSYDFAWHDQLYGTPHRRV